MTESQTTDLLQQHVAEKCARDRKARRSGIFKVTLYGIGTALEAYAYKIGELPDIITPDNLLSFGGAALSAVTSLHATSKNNKHEDQLAAIKERYANNQINQEQALRETEYHINHRRSDTKRYAWFTGTGTTFSTIGFGHALASGHMDNHMALIAAAGSILLANLYSVHSVVHGIKNVVSDKVEAKRVKLHRKNKYG